MEATHITGLTPYASSGDFCRIFDEGMKGLYLLAFLLTADREKAEQCFVSGLEGAVGNPVFKEWARSWARRAVILNAIRVVGPRPVNRSGNGNSRSASANNNGKTLAGGQPLEMAAVLELETFDRFAYVMTVLERYSDHECSVLLGCARRDVVSARTSALQNIGSALGSRYKRLPNSSSENPASHERRSSVLELLVAPRLATSG